MKRLNWNKRILNHAAGFCAVAGIILGSLTLSGCGESESTAPVTDPDAQIVITYPKGGETFYVGDTLHVKWSLQGAGLTDVNSVNVEMSLDSGKSFVTLLNKSIGTGDANWGDYAWKIPATLTKNGVVLTLSGHTDLFIRVKEYAPTSANQITVTKKPFSISTR